MENIFYWNNFIYFGSGPKRGADGKIALTLPIGDAKMAGITAEYIGKNVGIAGEHLSGKEMAEALSKALGEPVVYK
ncbi:MAG TPA: hypothetical protein VET23_07145 [Chitinophagaceae bacterium]|nr:hypothetical protein [Chitinophagaceae bacterium]